MYEKSDGSQDAQRGSRDIPNRQINSFQNMWYMLKAKNDRLARKIILCKKHLKIAFFGGHEFELPDLGTNQEV